MRSPPHVSQPGCVNPGRRFTRLNAAALTDQDALIISLSSDPVPSFRTLVDSGSEDQFLDIGFADQYQLPRFPLDQPLRLRLFDGSSRGR